MLTIFQGDDTGAMGKTVRIGLPSADLGDGATACFRLGSTVKSAAYKPGHYLAFNYTAAQTASFPLGVSYGTLYFRKGGLVLTCSNAIAVKVTDCVEEAYGASNTVPVSLGIASGYFRSLLANAEPSPALDPLTIDSTDVERRQLLNALRRALRTVPPSASPEAKSTLAVDAPEADADTTEARLRDLTNALRHTINSAAFRRVFGTPEVVMPGASADTSDADWRELINELQGILAAAENSLDIAAVDGEG